MSQATVQEAPALEAVRDVIDQVNAGRVFGEPIVREGLTVLPVARISGGAGGGSGPADGAEGNGRGGGFGITARPAGVYVIKDGGVSWRPAVDVNKVIIGGQLVAVAALLLIRTVVKVWARRRAAAPDE